jgi:hypothetical protein
MKTSVMTGDIIKSRNSKNSDWLTILKSALTNLTEDISYWEVYRGDSFQIEIKEIQKSFEAAVYIKACIKMIKGLDVRIAIGIGEKTFYGHNVSESNGEAFRFSGETLESLKKEKVNLKLKTQNEQINKELNLYFKLAMISMDKWTPNSAEIVKLILEHPDMIQKELAKLVGTNQEAISKRIKRAYLAEILELDDMYKQKVNILLS